MAILDCAAGTGDIARLIRARAPEASVTLADPNADMLKQAEQRGPPGLDIVTADAQDLPFPPASFDAYTISFGMRNVPRPELALEEAFRVLKPRGRFLMLEFAAVNDPLLRPLYDAYSFNVIPRIGQFVARDRDSYQYLVESIRAFPGQDEFAKMMKDCGFRHVTVTNYTCGIAACYSAFKPAH
ncbi:2-methoxy-6-polyprenyl-1,4-benzoquinol methylase [Gracilaria domingensis]|nr:2-methoxy-6-polyprenyl-1,4-benzoquinol methylase [Gracilaria domingensis]